MPNADSLALWSIRIYMHVCIPDMRCYECTYVMYMNRHMCVCNIKRMRLCCVVLCCVLCCIMLCYVVCVYVCVCVSDTVVECVWGITVAS